MSATTLTTDIQDRVMVITLNRPDRLNAFTLGMMHEMIAAIDEADANDDVRAVIVTGAGRGFCAGVDLDDDDAFTAAKPDPMSKDPEVWADPANRDMGGVLVRIFLHGRCS